MPKPKGDEKGIREGLSLRVGIDVGKFRAMNLQNDPGAIGDDQFTNLTNVRLDGTAIKPRPGLKALLDGAMTGCVVGIFDDRSPSLAFAIMWTL